LVWQHDAELIFNMKLKIDFD